MKWLTRTVVGLGLLTAGLTAFDYSLYQVLQIGTCASGGPYVSARECPSGTELYFLGLFGGIILGLVGTFIWALRGPAPGIADGRSIARRTMRGGGTGLLVWGVFFTVTALTCLWASYGPDADPGPGAKTGGVIVAVTFLVMGVPALVLFVGAWLGEARLRPVLAPATGAGATVPTTSIQGLGSLLSGTPSTPPAPARPVAPSPQTPPPPTPSAPPDPYPSPWPATPGVDTAPSSPRSVGDPLARLEKLAKLRDAGAISQDEFQSAKTKLLEEL